MSVDVAKLGIMIDTTDVDRGVAALNRMSSEGEKVTKSAGDIKAAFASLRSETAGYNQETRNLRASMDPLYSLMTKYDNKVDQLNLALKQGVIDQAKYKAGMMQLDQTLVGASKGGFKVSASGLRQLGFQLGQVAQQAAVTGNYMGALSVQLGDILPMMGFTGWVGTAAMIGGILAPLALSFMGATEKAKTLQDATDDLSGAVSTLGDRLDAAQVSVFDLQVRFGSGAQSVRDMNAALVQLAQMEAMNKLADQTQMLNDQFSGLAKLVDTYTRATKRAGGALRDDYLAVAQMMIRQIQYEFGLTIVQANSVVGALKRMNSGDVQEVAAGAHDLAQALINARDESGQLPDGLRQSATAAANAAIEALKLAGYTEQAKELASALGSTDIASTFSRANAEAEKLHNTLLMEAEKWYNKTRTAAEQYAIEVQDLNELHARGYLGTETYGRALKMLGEEFQNTDEKAKKAKFWRGGTSEAEKLHNTQLKEAEKWYNKTRTAAEQYAIEVQDLNELHAMGYLDTETYGRALKMLGEEFQNTDEKAKFWRDTQNKLKADLVDGLASARNFGDVLQALSGILDDLATAFMKAALQAALFNEGPLSTGSGGGLLGSVIGAFTGSLGGASSSSQHLLPSFDGGGDTWGGPRSGGIDGKGGRLSILHPNETVLDHTKPPSNSSAGNIYVTLATTVDARGAQKGVAQEVADQLERQRASLIRDAVGAVKATGKRGY